MLFGMWIFGMHLIIMGFQRSCEARWCYLHQRHAWQTVPNIYILQTHSQFLCDVIAIVGHRNFQAKWYSVLHNSLHFSFSKTFVWSCSLQLRLGFRMGMGKPTVLLKWVLCVWVQFSFLPYRNTPHTCAMVSWVHTGLLQYIYPWFLYFKLCFLSFFIIFYLCVTLWQNQIWLNWPCIHHCFSPSTSFLSLPLPSHFKNIVSCCSKYQKPINCSYPGW